MRNQSGRLELSDFAFPAAKLRLEPPQHFSYFQTFVLAMKRLLVLRHCVTVLSVTLYSASFAWNQNWRGQRIDCSRTHWMHTAKTASTFCLSLQHVCCLREFEHLVRGVSKLDLEYAHGSVQNMSMSSYRYESHYCYKFLREGFPRLNCTFAGRAEHIPLSPNVNLSAEMALAVVREPKSRVISAMLDGVHIEGFRNLSRVLELRKIFTELDNDPNISHTENLLTKARMYAYNPSLYGHQVKMLLGNMTLDLSVKTPELYPSVVNQAVVRLRQFFFVGVFGQYERSLRLFHALADVGTVPSPVELFPQRTSSAMDKAYLMKALEYEDPYDSLLYQRAQEIFEEEIAYVKQWKGIQI